jgi:hypothetical protein
MKSLLISILALSLFACAGAQTKIEAAKAKVDIAKDKADCAYAVLLPHAGLLEEGVIVKALKCLDVLDALILAGVVQADAEKAVEGLKACKLEEVAK